MVVDVGLILGELELRLVALDVNDQLDGIQVGALTSVLVQRPVERLLDLLAQVVAGVLGEPYRHPLLAGALIPWTAPEAALVDHLERPDLGVRVVLVVGVEPWARTKLVKLLQSPDLGRCQPR